MFARPPKSMSFEQAVERVNALADKPCDSKLLILYGLFKQANEGDNACSKPGALKVRARAKWNAWNDVRGLSNDDAKQQYVRYVTQLVQEQTK